MVTGHVFRASLRLSVALLAGCAAVPRGGGFADVQNAVTQRTGLRIHWDQGSAADQSVNEEIRAMLADELTAEEAVQIALLNNGNLQAVYEDLAVAQADLVQAGLLSNPVFDGEFKFHEGGGGLAFEGGVAQDFIDLLQIPLRKRVAASEFEAAKLRVAGAVLDLALQARAAFYTLQAEQQVLEMRRTVLEAAEASYTMSRRLREAGNIKELDLAQDRAQYEQAKVDYAAAEAAVLADRERLSVLMGLWGQGVQWKIADRLPEPPADEPPTEDAEKRAVSSSLDLGVYRQQITTAGRQLGLLRPFALLAEGEAGVAAEHSEEEGWAVGPSLALPIPLFDQGQARTAAAAAELRRARQLYAATAVEVRAASRAAVIRVKAARQRVEYIRRVILPQRQRIVEEMQLQYNAMQVGVAQVLQVRQQQIEAGSDYIRALCDYWQARAQLEQIIAGRLPRDTPAGGDADAPASSQTPNNRGGH